MNPALPAVVVFPGLDGTGLLSNDFASGDWQGHRALVISLPKTGPQDYPALESALISQLPAGPLVLVGESFSGPLAMRLARTLRERVRALVIVGGFCASPAPAGLALMPLRPFFLFAPPPHLVKKFLAGPDASHETVDAVTAAIRSVSSATLAERARVVLALGEKDCPTFETLPVLLIQARHDALLSWEVQSRLERHFPEAEVHWIDSPHLLLATRADESRQAILRFVTALAEPQPS